MARTPKDVTEAELAVLRVLWEHGLCSVRQIAERLGELGMVVQPATVQKLLERLEVKEWVHRDRSGEVQRFEALGGRDELIGRRLQGIAEELCEGSLTPLLSHLVKREKLSAADRRALRDLVDHLDQGDTPHRKRRRAE
jgi:BlaI family transcriptional regulator, penicillinase repressor